MPVRAWRFKSSRPHQARRGFLGCMGTRAYLFCKKCKCNCKSTDFIQSYVSLVLSLCSCDFAGGGTSNISSLSSAIPAPQIFRFDAIGKPVKMTLKFPHDYASLIVRRAVFGSRVNCNRLSIKNLSPQSASDPVYEGSTTHG